MRKVKLTEEAVCEEQSMEQDTVGVQEPEGPRPPTAFMLVPTLL